MQGSIREIGGLESQVRFLNDALESTSQAFGAGYPDGRFLMCNRAFCDLTGYTKEELLDGVTWSETLTPPEWREREAEILEELNSTGKPQRYEKEYIRKDGSRVPIELFVHRAVDNTGNVLYYYSFITDIAERKNTGEALRESEERFRSVFTNAAIGILIADPNRCYLAVNDRFCEITGHSREKLLTMGCAELVHPDDQAADIAEVRRLLRGDASSFMRDLRYVHANDKVVWVRVHVSLMRGRTNDEPRILAVVEDITERRRAEAALQESEERFRAFMNNSPAIAWMKDAQGRYVYLNKTYEEELGIRQEDRLGTTDFDIWPRDIAEEFRKSDLNVLVSGQMVHIIEEIPRKDGIISYWFNIKFPFRDASGNMFVGGIGVDITRQKQMEEAYKEAKSRNELYVDLMSHDINNINQIAMGYLEIAGESLNLDSGDKELIQKPLEALRKSIDLIENVRKLKKLNDGGFRAEVIDLNVVLMELKAHYTKRLDKQIIINYTPCPGRLVMANGLMRDVFSNIIGNSIKHTPVKHVIINIRLDSSSQDGKKYYKVAVEDSGPGIPDDMKSRVFGRFERGDTKAHGNGLGLYLVKALVDDYNGKVWVEDSVLGDYTQGTRFIIMLPAFEGETGTVKPNSLHIGIVEDDQRILDLYKRTLEKYGISVDHTAINGAEAVEMARNANPGLDVIIMDHRLPDMTGLEVSREILKISPPVKIIFISADASIEKEALKAGAYRFFHKPVALKDIVKAIGDIS
jgi:PAS domain S-box-containing protein